VRAPELSGVAGRLPLAAIPEGRCERPYDDGQQGHRAGPKGHRHGLHQAQGSREITGSMTLRRLELADMDAAARIHRAAFDRALPWLAGLHTPDEDRWFFRERVFRACEVWGA